MPFVGAVENKRAGFGDRGLSSRYTYVEIKDVVRVGRDAEFFDFEIRRVQ